MRGKVVRYAVMCALGVSTIAMGSGYVWDGGGTSDAWNDSQNWLCKVGPCKVLGYPQYKNDDAVIPVKPVGRWDVELVTKKIDDLTLDEANVDFTAASGTPTLTVDSITIVGYATVTISGATIVTD